jgi:hypothetical protein
VNEVINLNLFCLSLNLSPCCLEGFISVIFVILIMRISGVASYTHITENDLAAVSSLPSNCW